VELEVKARELLRAVESQEWARASDLADQISAELGKKVEVVKRDLVESGWRKSHDEWLEWARRGRVGRPL